MRVTRRWWALTFVASAFGLLAVLTGTPTYLAGAAAVAAIHITAQYAFLADLTAVRDATTVAHAFTPETVLEETPVEQTATVQPPAVDTAITATLTPPKSWDASPLETSLGDGGRTTFSLSGQFAVAGRFTAPPVTLSATDPFGLYAETFAVGPEATVTVDPSTPHDAAVFAAGSRIGIGYGEHAAASGSGGLDPGELRQYLPGDPTNRIDWNATARLGEPHVREFDTETDRDTLLFVDHRSSLADGPGGRTQLDYLREVALWFTRHAESFADPLALYTVGDAGITSRTPLRTGTDHYRRLEHRLYDLQPDDDDRSSAHRATSADMHDRARRLTDGSAFATTLRPYYAHAESAVERVETDPLFHAVTTTLAHTAGSPWVVVLTDDTHRAELHETVRAASRHDTPVSVFVSPNALFTPHGLVDADTAYADYAEFLSYRDRLTSTDTSVYEVGPGDRVDTVLTTHEH